MFVSLKHWEQTCNGALLPGDWCIKYVTIIIEICVMQQRLRFPPAYSLMLSNKELLHNTYEAIRIKNILVNI